ncbi:MAG TPA: hypothetical protein EYH15_01010 [Methanothermococcus okinawensis]|uniref:Uncharacterized protein n=1 Tax=Methanothermococcus okinawensis TaxID=155863 RepID=A0A832ZA63_9EURY|nr:hypothetical protein [Methanococcaceae archaeon]HIP84059.1 hypothetical protein [Methanothermococcus okinawensis]HIP90677.1 hypothetical protein [Methanothermococcus okinawensis]
MIKVYRFTGLSALLVILLIFLILFLLTLLISPIIILLILLLTLYLLYLRFKKSIVELLRRVKKKKIKISEGSAPGKLEIEVAKNTPERSVVEGFKDLDPEIEDFIKYLISKGFKYDIKTGTLYYGSKTVYPIYKKAYPINEIIRLYHSKPEVDVIVLGLKGTPDNPKFIYIIPVEESKERMSIGELQRYLKRF